MISITNPNQRSATPQIIRVLLLSVISLTTIIAQSQKGNSKFEIGGGVSAFIYQGDLTPKRIGSLETAKPGILVFVNYNLRKNIDLQGSFSMGSLKGDDARYARPVWRRFRNLNFRSPAKEIALKATYHLFGRDAEQQMKYAPYVSAGIGLGFFNVKRNAELFDEKYFETQPSVINGLQDDLQTITPKQIITIPVAIGVRRYYTERISFFGEANYRFMRNDYLDGFSNAGNNRLKDHFYTLSIGFMYKFRKNNSIQCPTY